MPRHPKKGSVRPPRQMLLFPETVTLVRVAPQLNCARFYRLSLQADLFGGTALVRNWGRIGRAGRQICDLHPDEGQALDALDRWIRIKRRRGYQETE